MILVAELLIIICLGFGANYYQPDLHLLNRVQNSHNVLNITDTLRMVGIMAQFDLEVIDNAKTSGNGQFLSQAYDDYINFIDTDSNRCNGMLVDPPPHTSTYFQKQLEAGGNYYEEVSFQALPFTANIIENPNDLIKYKTENSTSVIIWGYLQLSISLLMIFHLFSVETIFEPIWIYVYAGIIITNIFSFTSLLDNQKIMYISEIIKIILIGIVFWNLNFLWFDFSQSATIAFMGFQFVSLVANFKLLKNSINNIT